MKWSQYLENIKRIIQRRLNEKKNFQNFRKLSHDCFIFYLNYCVDTGHYLGLHQKLTLEFFNVNLVPRTSLHHNFKITLGHGCLIAEASTTLNLVKCFSFSSAMKPRKKTSLCMIPTIP